MKTDVTVFSPHFFNHTHFTCVMIMCLFSKCAA